MGTTSEKLEYLSNTKGLIKTSIENSGVEVPDTTTFREYPDKIDNILEQFSDELDTIIGGELSPSEPGKTITPTTTEQIAISQGVLAGGDIKVAGDANLTSENIAKDVSIFGVTGSHEGGIILPTLTTPAETSDIRVNKQTIDSNGSIITGTLPEVEIATPSITVSSEGLITAQTSQNAGIVLSGTKSTTQQLATQSSKIVTPSTAQQTAVSSGKYTTGNIYVAGDSNLVADNIKSGVNIFGVTGNLVSRTIGMTYIESSLGTRINYLGRSSSSDFSGFVFSIPNYSWPDGSKLLAYFIQLQVFNSSDATLDSFDGGFILNSVYNDFLGTVTSSRTGMTRFGSGFTLDLENNTLTLAYGPSFTQYLTNISYGKLNQYSWIAVTVEY